MIICLKKFCIKKHQTGKFVCLFGILTGLETLIFFIIHIFSYTVYIYFSIYPLLHSLRNYSLILALLDTPSGDFLAINKHPVIIPLVDVGAGFCHKADREWCHGLFLLWNDKKIYSVWDNFIKLNYGLWQDCITN